MIDFAFDEPLALLAEAFGQESDGSAPLQIGTGVSPAALIPSAAVIAASTDVGAEARAYTAQAE
jgi:hypothetical protein